MAGSMNKAILVGRLGRDPEVAYSASGVAVCNMSIATDESYTDRDGKKVDKTEWHKIFCFGKQAENCGKYLSKGSLVLVEGSIQTEKWQDKEGNDRYTTKIKALRVQFLESKGQAQEQQQEGQPPDMSGNARMSGPMDDAPF